ncbi:MAG: type II toxin-antitoxin system VapC family toxin [Chloroflexi bacterium]|nr:type II toxin-antitoxin system VapC family toxin [Chloroflexota bacterium]
MKPVLLDTHVLVWLVEGNRSLGQTTRKLADVALGENELLISAISFWEVAMLRLRSRLMLGSPTAEWRRRVLQFGIGEVPVSGDIGILATELEAFPSDPADRIVAATATSREATLITADEDILAWEGSLTRKDARI